MTEQQIKHLKTLLAASQAEENSDQLDRRILAAAESKAATRKIPGGDQRYWHFVSGLGTVGTAALAIVVTLSVFLGMSRLLEVDESMVPLAGHPVAPQVEVVADNGSAAGEKPINQIIARPRAPMEYPGMSKGSRDRLLVDVELPSATELLDSMEFSLTRDRSFAADAIDEALADINSMIGSGELDDARKRYERLRRWCDVCQLPDTLEALALARVEQSGRG